MILNKAYSLVLSTLMVMSLCLFNTGCSQATFDANVNKVIVALPAAELLGEEIGALVTENPKYTAVLQEFTTAASVDLPAFKATVDTYFADKSAGTKQALLASFETIQSQVNTAFLNANRLLDPKTDAAVLKEIAAFSAAVNTLALILGLSTSSAALTVKTSYDTVAQYIPVSEKEKAAASVGYTYAQVEAFGL